jgi:hypothetical protein
LLQQQQVSLASNKQQKQTLAGRLLVCHAAIDPGLLGTDSWKKENSYFGDLAFLVKKSIEYMP